MKVENARMCNTHSWVLFLSGLQHLVLVQWLSILFIVVLHFLAGLGRTSKILFLHFLGNM